MDNVFCSCQTSRWMNNPNMNQKAAKRKSRSITTIIGLVEPGIGLVLSGSHMPMAVGIAVTISWIGLMIRPNAAINNA